MKITDTFKDYYISTYPTDDLGLELSNATFLEILANFYSSTHTDVSDWLGVSNSVVRESLFIALAEILDVEYDVIYELWLDF